MATTDEILLRALRKRILKDMQKGEGQGSSIVNNLYGGGSSHESGGPIGKDVLDPGAFDYYVDIAKEADKDGNWKKKVHRYREPKGEMPPPIEKKK